MAEKGERIYVRKYGEDNPCDTCEYKNGDECDFCIKNYEWDASITRAEAIERIKKGLIKGDGFFTGGYDTMAEAALNALLGGKDA